MFAAFLGIGDQGLGQFTVGRLGGAARVGTGQADGADLAAADPEQAFGSGAEETAVAVSDREYHAGRIAGGQALKSLRRIEWLGRLQPHRPRQYDLAQLSAAYGR